MPRPTIVEIPLAEQARRRAALRRARYGSLVALPLLLLCAAGRTPSEVAAVRFGSRSSVYRMLRAYRAGTLTCEGASEPATQQRRLRRLTPSLKRSVHALLKTAPRASGWGRPRWSWAPFAVEGPVRRGGRVSAEPLRHWLPELGGEGKRAKVAAKDDAPHRVEKLARLRLAWEQGRVGAARFVADEVDIRLFPKLGSQGRPTGEQGEVRTPGTTEKRSLAGARDLTTGIIPPCGWYRKQTGLFLDLLETLDRTHPAPLFSPLTVVAENAKSHPAQTGQQGLAAHPRFAVLSWPPYGPRANPLERACGDVHDKGTRHHTRKRSWPLVQEGKLPLRSNGPWRYALSELYSTPEVTAAVEALQTTDSSLGALSQLAA